MEELSGVTADAQMAWLDEGLRNTDAPWTVVTMHHPLFSFVGGREHPSARERREALWRVLRRTPPDLVMTGHRHTYQRGAIGDEVVGREAPAPTRIDGPLDTVFVVTASSTKRGQSEDKLGGWERYTNQRGGDIGLARYADNTPLFAVIGVEGDQMRYRAVDATGTVYDAFVVTKDARGQKTLQNGPEADEPLKTYDTTGPYQGWDDLR